MKRKVTKRIEKEKECSHCAQESCEREEFEEAQYPTSYISITGHESFSDEEREHLAAMLLGTVRTLAAGIKKEFSVKIEGLKIRLALKENDSDKDEDDC